MVKDTSIRQPSVQLTQHLYAQRHLIECRFLKLNQFRRVATRLEKTAENYRAVVTIAAIVYGSDNCPHDLVDRDTRNWRRLETAEKMLGIEHFLRAEF
jgi:hypothetical protein